MNRRRTARTGRGMAMILVMIAVSMVFVVSLVLVSGLPSETRVSKNLIDRERAVYLAESGLAEAMHRLDDPPVDGEVWSGVTGRSLGGDGTYDVAITHVSDDIYRIRSTGHVSGVGADRVSQQIDVLVQVSESEGVNFDIVNEKVVINQPFAAKTGVAGAQITSNGKPVPVTVRVRIGSKIIDPYGNYASPTTANVNKNGTFEFVVPDEGNAGEEVTIESTSWLLKKSWYSGKSDSHYDKYLTVSTTSNSRNVKVLRNGDPVPNISAYSNQTSLSTIVAPYIDQGNGTIKLKDNQVIYLFELGTTDLRSSSADFQDLVLVVDFAGSTEQLVDSTSSGNNTSGSSSGSLGLLQWLRTTVDNTLGVVTGN